ncbi:MAG: hypothetical protein BGO01_19020 [Armatimonadetes bacterium 55-13]|nr:hypothetical protein [Armatimonadota bacterium]ODU53743.1 MAG: hypothetical protein ABT09_01170 [bacterium SCN 57-13]OJU64216.1 MAG: hypothetical protein BGO01_19020 [Armatimonadetes bacterium 55-13]
MSDRDPNEGSTDPMVAEYWVLGEAVQDKIIAEGYDHHDVDGIAVDIHDLLQAADRIREELAPGVLGAESKAAVLEQLEKVQAEIDHIAWHCNAARAYLARVKDALQ